MAINFSAVSMHERVTSLFRCFVNFDGYRLLIRSTVQLPRATPPQVTASMSFCLCLSLPLDLGSRTETHMETALHGQR
jgi:hypothetical protein